MQSIILLTDDNRIKALAVDCGMAAELEPRTDIISPYRQHITFCNREFFICITRFVNYPDPADNGYKALLVPKSFGSQNVASLFNDFISEGQDGPVFYSLTDTVKDENN